jgi:peptidyl-tRNA hydrolase, PTH1 family
MTWLIVGLGNPGKEYEKTRHNVGWRVVDLLTSRGGDCACKKSFDSELAEGRLGKEKIIFQKPLTYMNESGRAVRQAVDFWKIPADHVIVIHDDKDLPLGALRVRPDGSAGGHNGIKSLIAHLSTENFPRVRVGVGQPVHHQDTADFVLSGFQAEERPLINEAEKKAADAVETIIRDGLAAAMNKYS